MSVQRTMREPTFYFQFNIYLGELLEENGKYKVTVIEARAKLQKQEKDLDATRKALESSGLPHTFRYQTLEKEKEQIALSRSKTNMFQTHLCYSIEDLLAKVISFFSDIADDYKGGYLSMVQYQSYLEKYQYLFETARELGLKCYDTPTIALIKAEINKYLPTEIKN